VDAVFERSNNSGEPGKSRTTFGYSIGAEAFLGRIPAFAKLPFGTLAL
jgi:hypothetical protein